MGYDIPLTVVSAIVAVAVSGVGLFLAYSGQYLVGGAVAGAAISTMHYIGMTALKGPFYIEWADGFVIVSVVIGVLASALAFALLPRAKSKKNHALVVATFVFAICGL